MWPAAGVRGGAPANKGKAIFPSNPSLSGQSSPTGERQTSVNQGGKSQARLLAVIEKKKSSGKRKKKKNCWNYDDNG